MALNLPGADPNKVVFTRRESVEPHVREVINAEVQRRMEKEKRAKLTWSTPEKAWAARGAKGYPGEPIGEDGFDLRLPYMSYNGEYFVQNCKVFLSNGERIDLSDVPDVPMPYHSSCPMCRGREKGPCTIRDYVGRQLEIIKRQALALDPMLCKYCYEFTADTPDDYTQHMILSHPAKLGPSLGLGIATPGASPSSGSSSGSSSEGATADLTSPPPSPPFAERRAIKDEGVPIESDGKQSDLEKAYNVPAGTMTAVTMPGPIPVSIVPPVKVNPDEGKTFICGEANCGRPFQRKQDLKRHLTTTHNQRG